VQRPLIDDGQRALAFLPLTKPMHLDRALAETFDMRDAF
jgi:hypothetical protein